MTKYEVMIIVKPELAEEAKKQVFNSINDAITKTGGKVSQSAVWSEKRRLTVPIGKNQEGIYYLVNFESNTQAIKDISRIYRLNENILRFLFTKLGK